MHDILKSLIKGNKLTLVLTVLLAVFIVVDVTQAVGRILRKKGHEAVVYDILDTHGVFDRHWKKIL